MVPLASEKHDQGPEDLTNGRKRKRSKLAPHQSDGSDEKITGFENFVKLDSLKWNKISPPDHLDDYEGFFGLEEIDDVDVVRDGDRITYRYIGDANLDEKVDETASEKDRGASRLRGSSGNVSNASDSIWGDENEEIDDWSGFESENEETDSAKSSEVFQSSENGLPRTSKSHELHGNSNFAVLEGRQEEDGVEVSAWTKLGLSEDVLRCLSKMGFASPTPIQSQAIPSIMEGHDLIGKAPTGSGKTVAFGIPIIEKYLLQSDTSRLSKKANGGPTALILLPTRELAHQIEAHLSTLCSHLSQQSPRVTAVTGGLSIQKQRRTLSQADIIVATPGRLWEVISEGNVVLDLLKRIRYLVLDEADRLLNEGHFKELSLIIDSLDRKEFTEAGEITAKQQGQASPSHPRQTLVFSATFAASLHRKLSKKTTRPQNNLLNNKASMEYLLDKLNFHGASAPKFVDVDPEHQLVSTLREGILECPAGTEKDLYLYALTLLHRQSRTLIFVNSISAVRRLVPFLENLNIPALPLHSQMAQKVRLRSVERFSAEENTKQTNSDKQKKHQGSTKVNGKSAPVLVSTDVAARGLDIPNIHLVIHYHLPRTADAYVHRSGRTARASAAGSSVLLCAPEEVSGVRRLVAQVHPASGDKQGHKSKIGGDMRSLDLDRKIVDRLKPRAVIAKKLADTAMAKEKQASSDSFFREAAEDLGVDYDSDEFATEEAKMMGRKTKGSGRKRKQKEARELSKEEVGKLRGELRDLLSRKVNVGVSERYLAGGRGGADLVKLVEEMERGERGEFLGALPDIGFEV